MDEPHSRPSPRGGYRTVVREESPKIESDPPRSGKEHVSFERSTKSGSRIKFVVGSGMILSLSGFLWSAANSAIDSYKSFRASIELFSKFQTQLDEQKAQISKLQAENAALAEKLEAERNWTGAILSQALGVKVRKSDGSPFIALELTFSSRARRWDPHDPLVIVETPEP